MSMTKKNYEVIAAVLTAVSEDLNSPALYVKVVDRFSEVFARDNPNFKRDLFEKAAGIYSCEICKKKGGGFRTTSLPDSKSHFLTHLHQS